MKQSSTDEDLRALLEKKNALISKQMDAIRNNPLKAVNEVFE